MCCLCAAAEGLAGLCTNVLVDTKARKGAERKPAARVILLFRYRQVLVDCVQKKPKEVLDSFLELVAGNAVTPALALLRFRGQTVC